MNKNTKRFAISTLIAAAAGYVTGLLTAPKSGKETRKDIHDAAVKARSEAEKRLKMLHSELSEKIDEAKKQASKLTSKAKVDLDSVVNTANATKQKAREMLSAVREGQAEDKELQKAIEEVNSAIKHLGTYLKKDA